MNLTDNEVNDLYGRSVKGCLKSREALYGQYAAFLNSLCQRQRNGQFPISDLMSFANDTFMNILERNLFDPTKGIKFISYLGRSVSLELIRLKIRFKHPITNKIRVLYGEEFVCSMMFDEIETESCGEMEKRTYLKVPKELTCEPVNTDSNEKELLNKLIKSLTNDERIILYGHYKISKPVILKTSRQAIDQKRYKILKKLKVRLKELQNKGEL